ncbi:MAG TPA: hypothetical protein VJ464_30405 [Blastocatellia bacterium]|nr:hypothetical protein [Blastocatellia bacterium]
MKKTITLLIAALIAATLIGCAQPASDSNSAVKNVAAPATNSNAPTGIAESVNRNGNAANVKASPATPANSNSNSSQPSAATGPPDPAKMVGTYVMNQIQKGGVSTLITQAKIEYVFNANGRYSRVATVKGKTINTESGEFNLDGDKLTFKIVLSGKSINKKPIEKNYTVGMTPDGREVRLTSKTGEVALLVRTP